LAQAVTLGIVARNEESCGFLAQGRIHEGFRRFLQPGREAKRHQGAGLCAIRQGRGRLPMLVAGHVLRIHSLRHDCFMRSRHPADSRGTGKRRKQQTQKGKCLKQTRE
jgi:hypothetical protein